MRARIGMALIMAGGEVEVEEHAAIGIETFIGSGLPQTAATRVAEARGRERRAGRHPALVGEGEDALGARIDRLVERMAEAGHLLARLADRRGHRAATASGLAAGVDPRQRRLDQARRRPRRCRG